MTIELYNTEVMAFYFDEISTNNETNIEITIEPCSVTFHQTLIQSDPIHLGLP